MWSHCVTLPYQGLSQRGDIENDMAVNQGNFLELLQFIGKFDKTVAQKISGDTRNAKYTDHEIQNEILGKLSTQQPRLPVHTRRKNQGPGCPEDYKLICTEPQQQTATYSAFRKYSDPLTFSILLHYSLILKCIQ